MLDKLNYREPLNLQQAGIFVTYRWHLISALVFAAILLYLYFEHRQQRQYEDFVKSVKKSSLKSKPHLD